jgi:hypothetical protein
MTDDQFYMFIRKSHEHLQNMLDKLAKMKEDAPDEKAIAEIEKMIEETTKAKANLDSVKRKS